MRSAKLNQAVACAILLFASCFALSSRARALAPRAHLTWKRPPLSTCPSRAELVADVQTLSEEAPFVEASDAQLLLDGAIERTDEGLRARIVVRLRDGTVLGVRELARSDGDCAALRGPLALVLTMLIESARTVERPPEAAPLRIQVGLHGGVLSGALPRMTSGGGVVLSVRLVPALRLSVIGSAWLPVEVEGRQIRARLTLWSSGLELCGRIVGSDRGAQAALCAAGHAGATHASSQGLVGPSRVARLTTLAELSLLAALPLSTRVTATASAGFVTYFHRPRFYYERPDRTLRTIHRAERFGLLVRVALLFDLM